MDLFPTSYFPSIYYFKELQNAGLPSVSGIELYEKQTFRNRCEILSGNGIQSLSIPIVKPNGSKSLTKDVQIADLKNWRQDHWRAIESAYRNSPYFEYYELDIKALLKISEDYLVAFNQNIINYFSEIWDLQLVQLNTEIQLNFAKIEFLSRCTQFKKYTQVFSDRFAFQSNLSVLDLLFCEGPMGRNWLVQSNK